MYKADSDLFAIIWGLLAFALPVLASVFERKRKKQAKEGESVQEVEDDGDMFEGFAFTDLFKEEEREEPESVQPVERVPEPEFVVKPQSQTTQWQSDEVLERIKAKAEEMYKEQLVSKEGIPVSERIEAVNILGEVESENGCEVCKRVKDNPKDLILFGEIMNPKYKEF